MRLTTPQPQTPGLLELINQVVNLSFLLGIVLGVFLKMILEWIFRKLSRVIKRPKVKLSVLLDYTCEMQHAGNVKPLEPHLIITNTSNDKLSISRIDIQYGQSNLRRIGRGLSLQSYGVLYSSAVIQKQFELESKADLKIYVNTTANSFEIVETKPDMQLGVVSLNVMPPEVMRYDAISGGRSIGKSDWFRWTSIRPTIK